MTNGEIKRTARCLTLCVNYHSDEDTLGFVTALGALKSYQGDIYLVSNSPSEVLARLGAERQAGDQERQLYVDFPGKNLGYFGGAAYGLDRYLVDHSMPEWIMVANTDLSFPDPDFFAKLTGLYGTSPPAVIAPDIVLQATRGLPSTLLHQNPFMTKRPSAARLRFLSLISRYYPIYAAYELATSLRYAVVTKLGLGAGAARGELLKPCSIYAPFGACVLFHRSYFEAGGSLKYPSFLFGEELFIAESARKMSLLVIYEPRLRIFHHEHGSTRRLPSRLTAKHLRDSYEVLLKAYFNE